MLFSGDPMFIDTFARPAFSLLLSPSGIILFFVVFLVLIFIVRYLPLSLGSPLAVDGRSCSRSPR